MAQHLVGAKLATRFPQKQVPKFSYTAADAPTRRTGDFEIGDTSFHVTMTPSEALLARCRANLDSGRRPFLLVPEEKLAAAQQLAENAGIRERVDIGSVEWFVAQNISEIGEFGREQIFGHFRALLAEYNDRVRATENDPSLQIDFE